MFIRESVSHNEKALYISKHIILHCGKRNLQYENGSTFVFPAVIF